MNIRNKYSKSFLNINTFFYLKKLLRNFPFDKSRISEIQLRKLKKILIYSYENFDFYRNLMAESNFNPYKIQAVEEIQKLPIIDKNLYREFTYSLVKHNNKYVSYYIDSTSGSTGTPLRIYRSWNERAYMLAKYLRALFLNGYRISDKTYCLPSPHRITITDSILQKLGIMRRYSVAYTEKVEKMVDGYLASAPDFFYANKSQLVKMASYIIENNINIKKPRFYSCVAEVLDINSKKLIESVFGTNMFEIYGAVEFNNLAFQLLGRDYYFFNHDTNILELENNGVINKENGNCIITDLNIFSFPLIRYKLGDWLETNIQNGLQVIKKVKGRFDDWVTFRDGTKLPYHYFYVVMAKRLEVKQFRFIQESYDLINVFIVLNESLDKKDFEKKLIQDLKQNVSEKIDYKIIFMEEIPVDPSGKLRMVISKV